MRRLVLSAWLVPIALVPGLLAAQETVTFSDHQWTINGEARVEQFAGREALRMGRGRADLDDMMIGDGTIEFDFRTTGHRSFAGIVVRLQETNRDGEYFYLRPHQSNRFDALQYTPIDSGMTAWQLYPEHNAEATIPANEWMHVRLELTGEQLLVYVGDGSEPAMTVPHLTRGHTRGRIGLRSSAPRGGSNDSPEGTLTAAFANFVVRTQSSAASETTVNRAPADPRIIRQWAVSPAVPGSETPIEQLPRELLQSSGWTIAASDDTGRVNLSRYRANPPDTNLGLVLARVVIRSDGAQVKKLNFGFSDRVSVFLNQQVIYSANNSYLARSGRYLGVMTLENDALYLPLRQGNNELIFAVSEVFGGWGLSARLADMEGVRVQAPLP